MVQRVQLTAATVPGESEGDCEAVLRGTDVMASEVGDEGEFGSWGQCSTVYHLQNDRVDKAFADIWLLSMN